MMKNWRDVGSGLISISATFVGLCGFVSGVSMAAGQDSASQDTAAKIVPVSTILKDFDKAWNDRLWLPEEGRISKYLRPLNDPGWKRRMTALQLIASRGKVATTELLKTLENGSTPLRALSAQALGYLADSEARPALARAIEHDADPMVRLYAADSLGMLGGRDYDELLRRMEMSESNVDAKRHIRYALDREGKPVDRHVMRHLREWKIDKLGSAALGQAAPDFQLPTLDGQSVRLSDFRGKKSVILIFIYGDT